MFIDGVFYFCGVYMVIGNVDYVIYVADNMVYVIFIVVGIIIGEVEVFKGGEVGLMVVFVVVVGGL